MEELGVIQVCGVFGIGDHDELAVWLMLRPDWHNPADITRPIIVAYQE